MADAKEVEQSYSSSSSKIVGQCGYCGKAILLKEKILPLECMKCKGLHHVKCLRGSKPPVFLGDNLYLFTCSLCGSLGKESWERPHLQWVHVTHLAVYNLISSGRGGRRGFYRWNEDICAFIRSNWSALMPHRKKTQSWHSTVAGTLSVHCPATFKSGYALFGEHGWWTLTSIVPPSLRSALFHTLGKRKTSTCNSCDLSPPPAKKIKTSSTTVASMGSHTGSSKMQASASQLYPPEISSPPQMHTPDHFTKHKTTTPRRGSGLLLMTELQEKVLMASLDGCPLALHREPKASRLLRKLKVRARQRLYDQTMFDLDTSIYHLLSSTNKYVVNKDLTYYEQVVPLLNPRPNEASHVTPHSRALVTARLCSTTLPEVDVLDQLCLIPVLSRPLTSNCKTFRQLLCGVGLEDEAMGTLITSPYTTRKLKPFIFRSLELIPAKVAVNREITQHASSQLFFLPKTIDFCYLQEHHLPAVNNLVSHFFWPVDLSDCLQYPDFTCVVLFGKLVVGCACMTPDVKVNEAYISFLLVHPDFQRCSIGKIMLYHLIQSCMGKDITLHVSVDNPAMLLYQTMGFKTEKYCLDFYCNYYPEGHYLSKNAYFMRLRK